MTTTIPNTSLNTQPDEFGLSSLEHAPREWMFPGADEVFRGIYTRAGIGFNSEVLAVCSAIAGEGKTTVSLGLAVTIAQDLPQTRVLLVEMDYNNPTFATDFEVEATPGLIDCLGSGEHIQAACRTTHLENLNVVPAGGTISLRGRPLRSSHVAAIIDAMRQSYDVVILDLPPILVNSDAALLTDLADGVIVVVRSGVTPNSLVNKALDQVDATRLRGLVLNAAQTAVPRWLQRLVGM